MVAFLAAPLAATVAGGAAAGIGTAAAAATTIGVAGAGISSALTSGAGQAAIGGGLSFLQTRYANAKQEAAARGQMAYQAYMSGTSHRREMEDLRAGGLNPILTATGGPGASTPGGALAQVNEPDAAGSALAAAFQARQRKLMKQQTELARANTHLAGDQASVAQQDVRLRRAQTMYSANEGIRAGWSATEAKERAEIAQIEKQIALAGLEGNLDQAKMQGESWYKKKRRLDAGLDTFSKAFGGAAGIATGILGGRMMRGGRLLGRGAPKWKPRPKPKPRSSQPQVFRYRHSRLPAPRPLR